jgi:hypothetical protein
VLAVACLFLALTGCNGETRLSNDKAAELILANLRKSCQTTVVERNYSKYGSVQNRPAEPDFVAVNSLDNWSFANIVNSPTYSLQSTRSDTNSPEIRTYQYSVDGQPSTVTFARSNFVMNFPDPRFNTLTHKVRLEFCLQKPVSVAVLDVTEHPEDKAARVVFTAQYALTPLADSLTKAGYASLTPQAGGQQTITLQRLDATGWQVSNGD